MVSLVVIATLMLVACGAPAAKPAPAEPTAAPAAAEPTKAPEPTPAPAPTEAPAAAEKPSLTFWHTMNEQETPALMEAVNKAAEEAGVDVKVEYVPFDGAQQKYLAAAQGGNAPDVFRAEIAWTPQYADAGYLLDITDSVSAADKADYLAAPLHYNEYDGKLWGVPQVTDAPALLYNKELVKAAGLDPEKPPTTMDEFVTWCKALTKADGSQYGFTLTGGAYFFQPFMWAFGGGLIDEKDLKVHIADQGTIDAANFVLALRDTEGCMPKEFDPQNQYNNAMTAFKTGTTAMIFNGPWATADVLSGDQFKDPANFGIAPIPAGPAGQGSPVGGHNYVIYAGTAQPEAAVKFMTALNSTDNQGLLAEKLNLVPTRKSAYELPAVKANAILQGFGKQMAVATNRPVIPQGGQIYTDFDPAWVAVLSGAMTPQAAFEQVAAAWQKLLEQ
jgi:arabinogalactan oligomer/maltooligosaccharide transport system substrate-binding protein